MDGGSADEIAACEGETVFVDGVGIVSPVGEQDHVGVVGVVDQRGIGVLLWGGVERSSVAAVRGGVWSRVAASDTDTAAVLVGRGDVRTWGGVGNWRGICDGDEGRRDRGRRDGMREE